MGDLYAKLRKKLKGFIYLKGLGSIFDLGGFSWADLFPKDRKEAVEEVLSNDYKKLAQDLSSSLRRTVSALETTLSSKEPL